MNVLFSSVDQTRPSVDSSAGFALGRGQNTPLADQMQFSSILKTFVETPQEAMAAIQGPKISDEKPAKAATFEIASTDNDLNYSDSQTSENSFKFRSTDLPLQEVPRDIYTDDKQRLTPATATFHGEGSPRSLEGDPIQQPGFLSNSSSIDSRITSNNFAALVKNPGAKPIELLRSGPNNASYTPIEQSMPRTIIQAGTTLNSTKELSMPRTIIQAGTTLNSTNQINLNSPASVGSSALTDKDSNNIGKDLLASNTKNLNGLGNRNNNPSAAQTLANRQAQDLAQRLGQGTQLQVQVAVSNEISKQHSMPSQALTKGSHLATLMVDGEGGNPLVNSLQRPGVNMTPDRQATNGHIGQQDNGGGSNTQQGANAPNFAQAMRAQAQALGGQQAAHAATSAPKVAPISADATNVTNITGPSGQNQLSQMARANPASAARQTQRPPVPMEQVSVQIQRAVTQGADKINIKLHPAHLGRVEVRLDIAKDGQLTAVIMAEKPETLELLQRDIRGLTRSLQQAGLDANSNSFNFGLKQHSGQQADPSREHDNGHRGFSSEHDATASDEVDPGILMKQQQYGRNLSTNGGIDIRV